MNHAVNQRVVVHSVTGPRLFKHVRAQVHVFLSSCHNHFCIVTLNSLGSKHHGLQTRATDFIYRNGANFPGKTGSDHGLPRGILSKPMGQHTPHNHLVYILIFYACPAYCLLDHNRPEVSCRNGTERAGKITNSSPAGTHNNYISHKSSPFN